MSKQYCQNPLCYMSNTKDRLRGVKGHKSFHNRVINHSHYYGCCTQSCLHDYLYIYMNRIMNYIGTFTETRTIPETRIISRNEYRQERNRLRDSQ